MEAYDDASDTSRRLILGELRTGAKCVAEIVAATGLKQPNVSNHLARMRDKGTVRAKKKGRQVFYSLASAEVEAIIHSIFSARKRSTDEICLQELTRPYARAAVRGDEDTCNAILDRAFQARCTLLDIYEDLLAPAMTMVGVWQKVEAIDEGEEHMASAITERMMARAVQVTGPSRRNGKTALLGCAPNAYHVIGLRMIADYLRVCGWRVLFMGANVPEGSFLAALRQHPTDLVLLSCGADVSVADTVAVIEELAQNRPALRNFKIGVGGHSVTQHEAEFLKAGADFTATDLRSFVLNKLPALEA